MVDVLSMGDILFCKTGRITFCMTSHILAYMTGDMRDGLHQIQHDWPLSSPYEARDGVRLRVPIPRWRMESGEGS
jgi:hypothetical protein